MIKELPIPIIIVHFGYHEYLELAIRQVKFSNPNSEIVLLGDEANKSLASICSHKNYSQYSEGVRELQNSYTHLSTNGEEYEFFCIKRWLYIKNYLKAHKVEWAFAMDSDVLVFDTVSKYFAKNIHTRSYEAAYCIIDQKYEDFRWVASGGVSYVSHAFLEKFCSFISTIYQHDFQLLDQKMEYHRKTGVLGGINDMTFFYLFYHQNKPAILNLLDPIEGYVFNNGVHNEEEGLMIELSDTSKRFSVIKNNALPEVKLNNSGPVKLMTLHFQGANKNFMTHHYTASKFKFNLAMKKRRYFRKIKSMINKLLPI